MATIRDVARLAGVSTATVSATLNKTSFVSPGLQERVEHAVRTLGYAPSAVARSLKTGVTKLLGLIIADVMNPFFTELVHVIGESAQERGYRLILCHSDQDVEKELDFLRVLRAQRVDGIILAPSGTAADYRRADLRHYAIPIVLLDRDVPIFDTDAVVLDNRAAVHEAIDHILACGHRRIAIIAGPAMISTGAERVAGYRTALAAAGIEPDPAYIRHGTFRQDEAYAAVSELMRLPSPPTALFIANNQMAIGAMRAIDDMGLACPRDVSVVGMDDLRWMTAFRPRLTVVRQPVREMGLTALQLMLDRLAAKGAAIEPRRVVLRSNLVIRESCRPVRDQVGKSGIGNSP